MGAAFWLRWAWRGLRQRLPQVVAIAVIVALGSGLYAGLGSTSVWRTDSLDAAFARLGAHDVDVRSASGLGVPAPRLLAAVRAGAGPGLARAEARLVVDLPVRAGPGMAVPAAGVLVGVDLAGGVRVDRWKVVAGRTIGASDAGGTDVLLDAHFAAEHHLPPSGALTVAGTPVRYVGTVLQPEYLNTTAPLGATIQGAATRAVVFAPIGLVQRLADRPGQADDVVCTARSGADVAGMVRALDRSLPRLAPEVAFTVTARSDEPLVRALYDEVTSEQRLFDVFALLILAGAGFATFTLMRRVVESGRRDIGIAMALGVPRHAIALRPVLLAAEVAVTGVALGVVAGWALGAVVLAIIKVQMPLPYWVTPWQPHLFVVAAALGLAVPLAGSAYPVWRAVRVAPTDALLPPHLRGRGHLLTGLLRRVRPPGSTTAQAPFRRVAIAPARSSMTVLAIALIMAPLLAALGATDSTGATLEAGNRVLAGAGGRSLLVSFTGAQPETSAVVTTVTGSALVHRSALALQTGGYLVRGRTTVPVTITMTDLADPLAVPSAVAAHPPPPGGVVISRKAAADLGVGPGGDVVLRHPLRQGTGYRFVGTTVPVRAVVDSPFRFVAYMAMADEPIMGLSGVVNAATLVPVAATTVDQLQRAVSSVPGVASALDARSLSGTMADIMATVADLFVVLQIVIGLLAFLVAYNSSRIGSDERAREHATMMAFGVTVPRVVLVGVVESLLLGAVAVGAGIGLGLLVLQWVLDSVFPAALPDLAVLQTVQPWSYGLTAVIGLAAVGLAPTLVARRLRRMRLPDTLRYVE